MGEDRNIQTVGRYLSIAHRALLSRMDEELVDYDIGPAQLRLLSPLYEKEGLHQKELSKILGKDKGAVGRGLQKLEGRGFVERKADPEDERRNLIYLTEKSRKLRPELIGILESVGEEAEKGLSSEEIEAFTSSMKKISQNLGAENIEGFREAENV